MQYSGMHLLSARMTGQDIQIKTLHLGLLWASYGILKKGLQIKIVGVRLVQLAVIFLGNSYILEVIPSAFTMGCF